VLTLEMGGLDAPRESLIDVDGDGYLEATQWVQANQAMLAIDVNGDGFIGADELVNLQDRTAFNSLAWLDANGDGRVDDSDPAFSALRLWMPSRTSTRRKPGAMRFRRSGWRLKTMWNCARRSCSGSWAMRRARCNRWTLWPPCRRCLRVGSTAGWTPHGRGTRG